MGYGVTKYLLPDELEKHEFLIIPIIGYSTAILILYNLSWFGLPVNKSTWFLIFFIGLLNALVWKNSRKRLFIAENAIPIVIFFLSFINCFFLLISYKALYPASPNGDSVFYSNAARYLYHFPIFSKTEIYDFPVNVWNEFLSNGYRPGIGFFHALVNRLTRLEPFQSFAIINAFFLSLLIFGMYFIAKAILKLTKIESAIFICLLSLHSSFYWAFVDSAITNLVAHNIIISSFCCFIIALKYRNYKTIFLAGIGPAALLSTYAEYMPNLAFILLSYVIIKNIKDRKGFYSDLVITIKTGLVSIIVCMPSFWKTIEFYILSLKKHSLSFIISFGNRFDYMGFSEIFGLSSPFAIDKPPILLKIPLIIILSALIIAGIKRANNQQKIILSAFLIPGLSFAFFYRFILEYPHGYQRMLLVVVPFLIILCIMGIKGTWDTPLPRIYTKVNKIILSCIIVLLILGNARNLKQAFYKAKEHNIYLDNIKDIGVKQKDIFNKNSSIYLIENQNTKMLWLIYFLKDFPLSLNHYTQYFWKKSHPFYKNHFADDYLIINRNIVKKMPYLPTKRKIYENEEYIIYEKDPKIVFYQDNYFGLNNIAPGRSINFMISNDSIKINDQSLQLKNNWDKYEMDFGIYIPINGKLEIQNNNQKNTLDNIHSGINNIKISKLPVALVFKNIGEKEIPSGFIQLSNGNSDYQKSKSDFPKGIFDIYKEKITPDSNAFIVNGWHLLEQDKRWSKGSSLSLIKNPYKESILILEGTVPLNFFNKTPVIEILLNSHLIDKFTLLNNDIKKQYVISKDIMGKREWGELEIKTSSTFIPDEINNLGDKRELGIMIGTMKIFDLESLNINNSIDIGSSQYNKYLLAGWSNDEIADDNTHFRWAEGKNASLHFFLDDKKEIEMQFRAHPFIFPESPLQKTSILINNKFVETITMKNSDWALYSTIIPSTALKRGINTIQFTFNFSKSPSTVLKNNTDPRELAVAFDFVKFTPVSGNSSH